MVCLVILYIFILQWCKGLSKSTGCPQGEDSSNVISPPALPSPHSSCPRYHPASSPSWIYSPLHHLHQPVQCIAPSSREPAVHTSLFRLLLSPRPIEKGRRRYSIDALCKNGMQTISMEPQPIAPYFVRRLFSLILGLELLQKA